MDGWSLVREFVQQGPCRPMNRSVLIRKSLRYHWRNSFAVVLGVIVGAAVIVGALLVGDSVKSSLRKLALDRLGGIDDALVSPRHLFREKIAEEMTGKETRGKSVSTNWKIAPSLVLTGSAETREQESGKTLRRAGRVQIYGVDARFWKLAKPDNLVPPGEGEVTVNASLARHLQLDPTKKGQSVVLQVELPAAIPRDALLGDREETVLQVPLKVARVLTDDEPVGNFSLRPDQQLPWNAFVDLKTLQRRLQIGARKPSFREPKGSEARVNALLVSHGLSDKDSAAEAIKEAAQLSRGFDFERSLSDLQLQLNADLRKKYLSFSSSQMILDAETARQAEGVAKQAGSTVSPVYVYLVNETTVAKVGEPATSKPTNDKPDEKNAKRSMYSVAAGLDRRQEISISW